MDSQPPKYSQAKLEMGYVTALANEAPAKANPKRRPCSFVVFQLFSKGTMEEIAKHYNKMLPTVNLKKCMYI